MSKASLYFACASNTLRNPGRRSSAALLWACRVRIWGLACRPLLFVFRMILARCPKIPSAQLSPPATRKCLWYILAPFRLPLDCLSRNFLVLAGNFCLLTLEAGVNTLVWWFTPPRTIRPAAAPFYALAPSTPRRAEAGVCFWIGPETSSTVSGPIPRLPLLTLTGSGWLLHCLLWRPLRTSILPECIRFPHS